MKRVLLGVVLGAAVFSPSKADVTSFFGINPFPISQYQTAYMTLGGGVLVRQIPNFNVPYSIAGSTDPIFSSGASILTGGGGFTIGFRLDQLGIGARPRIEVAFGGWTGSGNKSGGEGGVGLTKSAVSIDGTTGVTGCASCDGSTDLQIDHTEIGGVLRLKTDFPVAPMWTITPSIGFLGSTSQTQFESRTVDFGGQVDETVSTRRLGGEVGLDIGVRPAPRWYVEGGVALAFFHMRTELNGSDCLGNSSPCTGDVFATTVTGNDNRFGIRVSMTLGATYDAGWLKVTIKGFGAWDNALPGVRNPTSTNGAPTGTASIHYDSSWAYGGAVLATFPFFR